MCQGKERSVEPTLLEVLGSLPDQRSAHGRRHPLGAISGLAVCAMLVGLGVCTPSVSGGETQGYRIWEFRGFHLGSQVIFSGIFGCNPLDIR